MTHPELVAAGFDLPPEAHARLERFVAALLAENEHINLTGAKSAGEFWRVHVLDSLALLPLIDALGPERLLDLGSGGGLPGVPLACVLPELQVTLLDSVQKKVAAVGRVVAGLGLPNVTTLAARAETAAREKQHRERYDAVAGRAVAAMPLLIEYAAGLARVEGQCWFYKSAAGAPAEVEAAAEVAELCGLAHVDNMAYRLPGDTADRVIVVYEKERPLDPRLPRPPGQAKKHPLR